MLTPRLAVVVPCYNEARRLSVAAFERLLEETPYEVLFVNDGSTDDTDGVLSALRDCHESRVTVLSKPHNEGKAEAVRSGINHALAQDVDYVGYWDADLATPLSEIENLLSVLTERPDLDMIFGSRVKLLGRCVERRAIRHYAGRVFATVVSVLLGLPIYDTQCGAKLFRVGPRTSGLFRDPFLSRWVFDVELIARYIVSVGSAQKAACGIYEYPLHTWTDVRGSKLKPTDFFVAFSDVLRIYWKYFARRTEKSDSRGPTA